MCVCVTVQSSETLQTHFCFKVCRAGALFQSLLTWEETNQVLCVSIRVCTDICSPHLAFLSSLSEMRGHSRELRTEHFAGQTDRIARWWLREGGGGGLAAWLAEQRVCLSTKLYSFVAAAADWLLKDDTCDNRDATGIVCHCVELLRTWQHT